MAEIELVGIVPVIRVLGYAARAEKSHVALDVSAAM
jgi:hypothetical protein